MDSHRDPSLTTRELVEGLVSLAAAPPRTVDDELRADAVAHLCELDPATVSRECERYALQLTKSVWSGGWQPVELVRQVRRTTDARTSQLALLVIGADHARRRAADLDARWARQLDDLAIPRMQSAGGWLAGWAEREPANWADAVRSAVTLLRCLASLTRLPFLIPPPGTNAGADTPIDLSARTSDPILERVRALLAQAESTTFEAEAEAFTAKAQELMTRHAIDVAMVSARADRAETPVSIRVPIDDPYFDAKALLLHYVAQSSRCRSVIHDRYAMSTVIGYAGDIAATEVLFTSLLVQAQAAMHATAAAAPAGARARSRSFRSAFLTAYAHRIGARLAEINAGVIADADAGRSILPVLAARSAAVDTAVDEMFGELSRSRARRGYDPAGWASGHLAADRAQLTSGDLTRGDTAAERASNPVPLAELTGD